LHDDIASQSRPNLSILFTACAEEVTLPEGQGAAAVLGFWF
jgi:hypothetical protein